MELHCHDWRISGQGAYRWARWPNVASPFPVSIGGESGDDKANVLNACKHNLLLILSDVLDDRGSCSI